MSKWKVPQRSGCRALQLDPTRFRYKSRRPAQAKVETRIKEIYQTRVRFGYRRAQILLNRGGSKAYFMQPTTQLMSCMHKPSQNDLG